MMILGISCFYHDAAAALIVDGEIVAAAEEERFSRIKHDSGFPKQAIDFCLEQGGITATQLDYVVFYEKPFRKFHRIIQSAVSTYPHSYAAFREAMRIWLSQKLWVKQEISTYLDIDSSKILFCEHHLSHAASAFYPSPFQKAAILTVDGVGEWATASWGMGEDNKIIIKKQLNYPQSLGLLYSAFTAFLGFEVNEGEWKVMGLAPYGKPKYTDNVWKVVRQLADGSFSLDLSYFSYHYSDTTSYSKKFIDLFGQPILPKDSHVVTKRSADIAASIQAVTEDILVHMSKSLYEKTGLENLCMAGGVALNSVANYKILQKSGFKNIYIQPAAGDSGGALGAALYATYSSDQLPNRARTRALMTSRLRQMNTAYLGREFSEVEIKDYLIEHTIPFRILPINELVDYVVDRLVKGKVVGWMQGRFEWGPRALGNRSILADARNPRMKDVINAKVKFREAFRPFAPSVLAEQAHKVFELPPHSEKHHPLRFMQYVVPVKKEWRKNVPAITHQDGTARPQLVFKKDNPLYYDLIDAFYKKTGVPLVLNTSFNLKGEPIVASPEDSYSTFSRSGIDLLVMGNCVCEK